MFGHFPEELLEQFMHDYAERRAMAIGYPQQSFVDKESMPCNKPRPDTEGGSSHIVKACYDGAPEGGKIIHFGAKGVKGSPKKEGESEAYRKRRESFKARHAKNIAKGPSSAAWWAAKTKW
jgi:hypothetical protein